MLSKIKNVKIGLLILMVIGLCTGCNGNHAQDTNKDLNDSQVK